MKKSLLPRVLLLGLAGLCLGGAMLAALALEGSPRVTTPALLTPEDVERTKSFLRRNDPRRSAAGELRTLQLPQAEVELLLNQLAQRYLAEREPALRARFEPGLAHVEASLALRGGLWLNFRLALRPQAARLQIDRLQLGSLPLPAWLGRLALESGLAYVGERDELQLAREMLRNIHVDAGQMTVVYQWRADSYPRLMAGLIGPADQQRLRAHAELLASWTEARAERGVVPLAELLPASFGLALQRSGEQGADAAAENRAALLSLAFYALGRSPAKLLADAHAWPQPRALPMQLQGRGDFPLHFIVSAALAAAGGGPLADAIGVYKEQHDVRYGSGFSFNDLAADRAGTRFGLLAVREPQRLQQRLARGLQDRDLLPDVSDLPEYLSESEFQRRFGSIEAPAYRRMMAAIEARLDTLALLR